MNKIALIIAIFILIAGCKTDIDVIAPWKETTVVYGLLNQSDTAHYIKINKAFLGEGNALEMAQVKDSSNYNNQLQVVVERWKNGAMLASYNLQKDTSISKETGIFSAPQQTLYKFTNALFDDSEYTLTITNTQTGKIIKSKTSLVKDFNVSNFAITSASPLNLVNSNYATTPFRVTWNSSLNGKLYEVKIRLNYTETENSITSNHFIDWQLGQQKATTTQGAEALEIDFLSENYYSFLGTSIPVKAGVQRAVSSIQFIFSVAADDFNTYLEVNQPSSSINQEKPEFSNIENGIGLFSARYTKKYTKQLNAPSLDSLKFGKYTSQLGF